MTVGATTYGRYERFQRWSEARERRLRLWERFTKADGSSKRVTLVWFSKADNDNTYHICRNCPYYYRIREQHLLFRTEEDLVVYNSEQNHDMSKYQLCDWCEKAPRCESVMFNISQ